MTKNMTRKGLAIGAAATLMVSGLVGVAPANAAGLYVANYVSLLPNAGTAYATISSEAFDLKSNVVGSLAGTTDKNLKFLVTDPNERIAIDVDVDALAAASEAAAAAAVTAASPKVGTSTTLSVAAHGLVAGDVVHVTTAASAGLALGYYTVTAAPSVGTFTIDTGNATAMDISTVPVYTTADTSDLDARDLIAKVGNVGNTNHFATATVASGAGITDGRKADGSFVVDTQTNANSVNRVLRLVNTSATGATTSVTVTAWVDDNDDNAIDSTEYVSETRTVTFYATADLTVVSSLSTPVIADATIAGTVSVTPALNGSQITTGSATAGIFGTATLQSGVATVTTTWNSINANWDVSIADNNNVEVGTHTFRASVDGTAVGNTASLLVSTATAADTEGDFAATVDQTGLEHDTASSTGDVTVRAAKSATGVFTVKNALGAAVGAGKSVLVKYSAATTSTDWTVNGTKVLDNAASADVYYTTDANGQLTLAVSSTSGTAGDAITIEVRPEGITGAAASKAKLSWATAIYAIVDLHAPANGAARNLVTGGTHTFSLFAGDQWNAPMTGDYRLQMTASGRADGTTTLSFSGGTATYSVTDAALGSGSTIAVATQLQKLTGGVWANSTAASDLANVTVTVAAAPSTSIVLGAATYTADSGADASADTAFDLWEKQIVAYNAETSQSALVAPYNTVSDDTASIAMGAGTGLAVGDTVTVSGSGLWFAYLAGGVAGSGAIKRLAQNSMTFVLDNAADVIGVYSNTYVKNAVVTVSAQGRSGTTTVTSHAATADSGASVNWTVPTSAAAGTTFTVTAQLVDAFGNVVDATAGDVSVTYTGPGFVSGSLPTDTNALGVASFAVLLGSADSGTATVTFAYDTNADGDTADLGEFVTTKTIAIGAAAAAAGTKVNAGSFKGFVAVYAKGHLGKRLSAKVGKDWVVVPALDSNFVRVVEFTGAGYTIAVRIYIDRVLVNTITVTTK